jgi:hypothetical protein
MSKTVLEIERKEEKLSDELARIARRVMNDDDAGSMLLMIVLFIFAWLLFLLAIKLP